MTTVPPLPANLPTRPELLDSTLIDAATFASMLGVSPRAIWSMRAAGKLPQPIKVSRLTRWPLAAVKAWIAEGCPEPITPAR